MSDDERDEVLAAITEAAGSLGMTVGPVVRPTDKMRANADDRIEMQEATLRSRSGTLSTIEFPLQPRSRERSTPWDGGDDPLWLLTPDELASLPEGTSVVCIDGSVAVVGTDLIDSDTRFGYTAYGLIESQIQLVRGEVRKYEARPVEATDE